MLTPKTSPLSLDETRHLLNRTSFGADAALVNAVAGSSADAAVASLIASAVNAPDPLDPDWAAIPYPGRGSSQEDRQAFQDGNPVWLEEVRTDWVKLMASAGFRERLVLFWHNHFVTEAEAYSFASLAHRYIKTLRRHAFGNYRDFVRDIGVDGAMLLYLNGHNNTAIAPNENYARELLELFTMGPVNSQGAANYSEDDIREIARALTGWAVSGQTWEAVFRPDEHDHGLKTIFGITESFGYEGVIDLVFEARSPEIARFVCKKLAADFLHPDVSERIVADLADVFIASDFSVSDTLIALLSSQEFYDESILGARVKPPVELTVGLFVARSEELDDEAATLVLRATDLAKQRLLDPPNVAGWPGHHDWLTTNTLPLRWLISDVLLIRETNPEKLISWAEQIHDPSATYAALQLPLSIADELFAVPLEWVEVPEQDIPFEGDLDTNPLPDWLLNGPAFQINFVKQFLGNLPWYEWNLFKDGSADRILVYLRQLTTYPEYQLQ